MWNTLWSVSRYLVFVSDCPKQKDLGKPGTFHRTLTQSSNLGKTVLLRYSSVIFVSYSFTLSNVPLAAYTCK